MNQYDAIIVGGGMVGAAVALGLAKAGWQVILLERNALPVFSAENLPDIRVSAISCRSVELLKELGAWSAICQMRVAPYRQLQTWENPADKVIFTAHALGLNELGYMVENSVLQLGLWQQFPQYSNLHHAIDIAVTDMQRQGNHWQLALNDGSTISAPLVIAADGANSQIRHNIGIGLTGWQYRQSCLLITVKGHNSDITWQQFYPSGPRAFLPLYDDWGCLAWYDSPQRIKQLEALSNQQLQQQIQQAFPSELGPVAVHNKASFPLVRRHAQRYYQQGVVLVGDAAHTINPLAGQGVNLGYRDVQSLLDVLCDAKESGEDYASDNVLARYQRWRRPDNLLMQSGMDLLYYTFSNQHRPIQLLRNCGFKLAEGSGILKNGVLKYALGLW